MSAPAAAAPIAAPGQKESTKSKVNVRQSLSGVWEMLRPRKGMLFAGFLLIIVNRIAGFGLPFSTKLLIDNVLIHHKVYLLSPIVLGLLLATLIQAVTSFALSQLLSKAAWRLITDLRIQVQEHIGRLPIAFYDANRTGVLVSRIMSDVEGLRNLVGTGLVEFLGGVMTAALTFVVLLWMNVKLTLMVITIMGIFVAVMKWWFGTLGPLFKRRAVIFADVTGRLTESLGGVRVVKSYRAEKREAEVFASGARELLDNHLRGITNNSLMGMSSTVVIGVVASLVMFFGAHSILGGSMTLGGYITYTVFLAFMVAPLFQVVSIATQLTEAIAGLSRTREILSESTEDSDPRRTRSFPEDLHGSVTFDNVQFSYVPGKPVLHGISFTAPPGSVTALVGPSGSGKSTIINLVNAFHTADSGTILVDGIDLTTVELGSYRSHLGVVLQESFLFDGTIRDNILFSRPDATESEVLEAARIARVDEFVERMPEGYGTIIGERGVKLSGGQRQRLSIARAILADPRILILDEATSSLDSESEALIQEGLSYLMRGRTTFVIAHRLSTIRQADQIFFLQEGVILERGTHDELIAARGRYYDLYTRQYALESNLFLAPGEGDSVAQEEESVFNGKATIPSFSQALRGAQ
ncbi:ABC transporter ATP-binding protein [Silvibacterium dinghuense]|uniref:ABC transporter ATP-binding protein n=1 Tax=Silvibacterium dinghuense TaxID=1560006 RepID=A0A4Q1SGS9_9BACT|nr:ABC transporter ATP-binding protein [Silvibacterium dinghuense]RXS96738.1 ABC transporter ATP-binding protein [Silvibacterium dinghuense]GGG93260.1 putative ABC transporter ATP-binding protein YfiC [Silvibacterium dinghuense]